MRKFGIFLLFVVQIFFVKADEKFQVNGILIPSYEGISMNSPQLINPYDYRLSYGFGAEMKYFMSPKISTNFGIQFNNRGFLAQPKYAYYEDSISTKINISCLYLTFPFDLCFNFQPAFRTEIFVNAGISYGILLSQTFRGQRVPEELGRPDNYLFEGVDNKRNNIEWFDNSCTSVQAGFGISRYIKSRMVITIHPTVSFQIDGLLNPEGPILPNVVNTQGVIIPFDPRLKNVGLQLKLGYYFSDQIENTNKKL